MHLLATYTATYHLQMSGREFPGLVDIDGQQHPLIVISHVKIKNKGGAYKMALENVKDIFDKMAEVFDPDAAQGLNAVFQFEITGDGGGNWNIIVKDGTCEVIEGSHDEPTVTLTMSAETWLSMINQEINGMQAFMDGRLKAAGDIMLAQRVEQLFPL